MSLLRINNLIIHKLKKILNGKISDVIQLSDDTEITDQRNILFPNTEKTQDI